MWKRSTRLPFHVQVLLGVLLLSLIKEAFFFGRWRLLQSSAAGQNAENKWPWRASPTWDVCDTASTFNVATGLGKQGQNQEFCKIASLGYDRGTVPIHSQPCGCMQRTPEADMTTWMGERFTSSPHRWNTAGISGYWERETRFSLEMSPRWVA